MNSVDLGVANCNVKELTTEQKAEVRKVIVEQYKQIESNNLERTPNCDEYFGAAYCFSPKTVANGVISLTAVVTALKTLAQTGFDIWDEFTKRFGKPESKEEEQALKAALNVDV
ncbi:MAG: hypothetical protein NC191_00685 [Muribaculaceae bacterium]|nr:hypothetical protein [Muribaculaceae bacterium]